MMKSLPSTPVLVVLVAALAGLLLGPSGLIQRVKVLGVFKQPHNTVFASSSDFKLLKDTVHCEDVHYHAGSNQLFTACEDVLDTRFSWFPSLGNFDNVETGYNARGSLKTINPVTLKVTKLKLEGFKGPFITHGIDILDDPERKNAVYIFAINHPPNDRHYKDHDETAPKARSVVEVFHHVIGSGKARHIRTVFHPLVTTPNDLFAISPTSFFVTNDHFYRQGGMRMFESIVALARWTNVVHVSFTVSPATNDSVGVAAHIALDKIHHSNGLGHGRTADEVAIASAGGGRMFFGTFDRNAARPVIKVADELQFDSTIDNPSYFSDPYATAVEDKSCFLQAGLTRGWSLEEGIRNKDAKDSMAVWRASPSSGASGVGKRSSWKTDVLFEDDGHRIRTASAAVLVAEKPSSKDQGKRRARLFVTGFMSSSMAVVNVEL